MGVVRGVGRGSLLQKHSSNATSSERDEDNSKQNQFDARSGARAMFTAQKHITAAITTDPQTLKSPNSVAVMGYGSFHT